MKKIKKLITWVVALAMCFSLTDVSGLTSVTAFAAGSNYQVNLFTGGSDTFDDWDEALAYLENGGGGDLWLLKDVTVNSTLTLTGEITMNLNGYTITINSDTDPAIRVESGASWIINCSCTNGSGGVKNTGSGPAVEVNGALWLACGTYESGSGSSSTITGSGTVTFGNLGNAANCLPTVINDNSSSGRCFSSDLTVNAQVGMFIPGDNDAEISGTYRVSNVLNGQDGYVVGTLSMTFDEDDTEYENPIVILTAAATGTQYTLTEGADYTTGDKIVSDDSVGYMVTPTDRTGTLLTYTISSDDDDSDDDDNTGDTSDGYYVSEVGEYIPGTLDVTLDANNEAVVTVTAEDGTVYTLAEGTDYTVSYEQVGGDYVVTVTLLDENGDAYGDEYTFEFTLYHVSEVDGWISGTLDVALDENNEAVVTVTAEDGTVYTLVEGTDYTVSYDTTDDGIYIVTVTLLDENGDAYGDEYTFEFALEGNSDEGYYVSEVGSWVPGTVSVTLDDNNEAIVKLTDADGNVYTLVEGMDYTVSYATVDGTYFVVVTYIDENGDAYDQDAFPFVLASQGGQGYYVSEVGDWIPGSLNVTLDENNEAIVTLTDADGNVYTLVEGVDYIASYAEVDGMYVVTVTLLDENGDAYASYEFVFDLGADATDIVKTGDNGRVWMYTLLAMAAAAAVALVFAGNKKYARK